ncbi:MULTISPECIES: RidA family protein [unclassified Mycolicibacterium]|uniref:RidA family protein n=1 Tax=unclassified Mycolicibacterium TaxID=2636767 RepID=UPI002ED98AF6
MPSARQPVYLSHPEGVAPPPGNVFSHAVIVGDTVYASGQNGIDATGMLVDGFEDQTAQAFENLDVVLKASGSGLEHVVKVQVLVAEPHDVRAYMKLREKYLPQRPASTLFAVKAFAMPGLLVELDATAVRVQ